MRVVVFAYVVQVRRQAGGTPIDESGEELRMRLWSIAFNADLRVWL